MIPLQYIEKVANQLDANRHKLSEKTIGGSIHTIGTTSTQLLYLGESIIHWIKLQEENFVPRYSTINLHTIVEELADLHRSLIADKNNTIKNEIPEDFYCTQEAVIIKIVLHNLFLNANKFTSNGTITIKAQCTSERLTLTVSDTGVGMDKAMEQELNNFKSGASNDTGWGLGYRLIVDLLKFIHGESWVESTKGKGTTVTIDIALKDDIEEEESEEQE